MSAETPAFTPDVLSEVLSALPEPAGYVVALSGGGDSTALLLALHALDPLMPLRAVHVSHGLQPGGAGWAERCRSLCRELGVPLEVAAVEVGDGRGRGLEAAAREARYRALGESLGNGEMLLTGHHRDDQAETLLLQLARGAGLDGASGMAPLRPFGPGWLARPLLETPREALRQWLAGLGREWVEDPDNENLRRGRNFVRHRVIPALEQRWPDVSAVLARDADNLRDARAALESWGRESLASATTAAGAGLRVEALRRLHPSQAREVLRLWLRDAGFPVPGRVQLAELESQALGARADAAPRVSWPRCEVRRYRGVLHAMRPHEAPDNSRVLDWDTRHPLKLPGDLGRLVLEGRDGAGPAWRLVVGFRRGGERIRLPGRGHRTQLKTLLQELGVPPWERDRLPLVFDDGALAAVGDWQLSDEFAARLHAAEARLRWEVA